MSSPGHDATELGPVLAMCVCQLRAPQFRLLAIPFPKSDDEPEWLIVICRGISLLSRLTLLRRLFVP